MIPAAHPLAAVDGAFNAVFVEAEAAGQLMFYGQGAGGAPTASAGPRRPGRGRAQPHRRAGAGPRESTYASLPVRPMGTVPTRYHVSLEVADRAGVLAADRRRVRAQRGQHRRGPADRRRPGRRADAEPPGSSS
jgi:homoserine dehydrogenase